MGDEVKISIQADDGIKNQWARGLFYRGDGKKRTLIPKNITAIIFACFIFVTGFLLFQGPPDIPGSSSIAWEVPVVAEPKQEIPPVASVSDGTIRTDRGSRHSTSGGSGHTERKVRFTGPQLIARPHQGKIPPGSMLKARLISGGSNGPVRAEVIEAFTLNGETLIEEGSILVGSGQSTSNRLVIRFSQLVTKDGAFESVDAQACDGEDKIVGIKGSQVGNQGLKLALGIGLNFAAGASAALQDRQVQNGAVVETPSLKNVLLNGAGTAAVDQSKEIMSDLRSAPHIIEVPEGTPIYVLFQGG